MQEKTRAFDLPKPSTQVLDIGMAPGGYTATVFKHSPHAEVFAITLPESDGGVPIIFPHFNHDRLRELDVTMLAAELGVDIPQDRPDRGNFLMTRLWPDKSFGLVICDGNMPLQTYGPDRNVQKRKRSHLECSQLILAMQRVKTGGNLILLLHHVQEYSTVKLVATFDKFASIQLFKPFKAHRHRGSFYLIAKNIQRDHADAKAAVADWKQDWKEEAFSTTASSETPVLVFKPAKRATEASELLESFGDRLVTLGKPIWKMQNDALRKTGYNKEDETAAREPNQVIDHSAHLEDAEIKAKVESGPEPADDGLSDQNGTAAATMPGIDSEKDLSDLMEHTRLDASAK